MLFNYNFEKRADLIEEIWKKNQVLSQIITKIKAIKNLSINDNTLQLMIEKHQLALKHFYIQKAFHVLKNNELPALIDYFNNPDYIQVRNKLNDWHQQVYTILYTAATSVLKPSMVTVAEFITAVEKMISGLQAQFVQDYPIKMCEKTDLSLDLIKATINQHHYLHDLGYLLWCSLKQALPSYLDDTSALIPLNQHWRKCAMDLYYQFLSINRLVQLN